MNKQNESPAKDIPNVEIEQLHARNDAVFNEVVGFVKERGCPCAFPRLRFLLTYNPVAQGVGPRIVRFTQELIYEFLSEASDDKAMIIADSAESDSYTCKVCDSRYQMQYEEYSINMIYSVLILVELKAVEKGAPFTFPLPLPGGVFVVNELRSHQELFDRTLIDANPNPSAYFEYMTALK